MANLSDSVISALISSSVITAVLGLLFRRWMTRTDEEIKTQHAQTRALFESTRSWKERCVTELLAPLFIHFDRTSRAFGRWKEKNLYLEAKVIREGNLAIRNLLLEKSALIPPELRQHAGALVEHYDFWLEEFERLRGDTATKESDVPFVFTGPKGFPFPREAEAGFKTAFEARWKELYGATR